jgi:hypothetical protein
VVSREDDNRTVPLTGCFQRVENEINAAIHVAQAVQVEVEARSPAVVGEKP